MIYLTTGGNGAGKTLITLKDVRDQQVREGRPVYFHGFSAKQQLLDWGWQEFDPKKWQDLPDGSICVMDECQNEFPAKITEELRKEFGEMPDYINAVAQFRRKRGFDFWMITPHPRLIHMNIRQLIESPSWHRHFKRVFGTDMVSELRFNFANLKCEQPSAGKQGQVTMRPFPKEVYEWYSSASLHTGKRKLPKQIWVVVAAAVIVPAAFYGAWKSVMSNVTKGQKPAEVAAAPNANRPAQVTLSVTEYLAMRTARVPDFPHTAPAYDDVTKPVVAPYPAACIYAHTRKTCTCYTQQGTIMQVSGDTCMQVVKNGFFVDWQQAQTQPPQQQVQREAAASPAPQPSPVVNVHLPPAQQAQPVSWEQALASRNAQVRSSLGQ